VDNRLFKVHGQRLHGLRRQDLPEVARAIVAVVRKQAQASRERYQGVGYVRLSGSGIDEIVLASDWDLVTPFIEDGTFSPLTYPTGSCFGYLDPDTHFDGATLDRKDWYFYQRVLGVLEQIFTDSYPVPNT
jgi:hypothetical protein